MNFLLRIWGLLTTVPNRLFSQWGLVLASVLGLVSSISLIMSIPLYADSIYYQTLQTNINDPGIGNTTRRPPFAFLFHYSSSRNGPKEWEDIQVTVNQEIKDGHYPEAREMLIDFMQKRNEEIQDIVKDKIMEVDAAENFTICSIRTSGCLAGLAIEIAFGSVRPNFFTYSIDCPPQ